MSHKSNILLVEDNENLLRINRELLESDDCAVHAAPTLADARNILKTVMPDVAILDIMLPDGSGLEFAAELRKICRANIIFLTAKREREDILAGYAEGAINYFPKPYDPKTLKMTVTNILTNLVHARSPRRSSSILNDEELEVARLVIKGESNKNIAAALSIAESSVKSRLTKAYRKLGINGEDSEKRNLLAEVLGGVIDPLEAGDGEQGSAEINTLSGFCH